MVVLVVNEAEADRMKAGESPIVVQGPTGETLGFVTETRIPDEFDQMMMERIRQNRGKPTQYFTTAQVLEHLRQLEAGECDGR